MIIVSFAQHTQVSTHNSKFKFLTEPYSIQKIFCIFISNYYNFVTTDIKKQLWRL